MFQFTRAESLSVAAFFLAGVLVVYVLVQDFVGPQTNTFMIETERIGTLLPHEHELGRDSVTDEGHHVFLSSAPFISAEDVWISKIEFELVNAPATTLHHADVRIAGEPDRLCPRKISLGRRIVAFSEDQVHAPYAAFSEGQAILIPKGEHIRLWAMIHNPLPPVGNGDVYHNVSVRVTLHTIKSDPKHPLKPLSYQLMRLQDMPCGDEFVFSVPPKSDGFHFIDNGSIMPNAAHMTFERPARIVYWGGHLHGWEGGRELIVKQNGEEIARFQTSKAADDPYRYDTPHKGADIRVATGDVISIEAVYDNPSDEAVFGAMGQLGFYYAEE